MDNYAKKTHIYSTDWIDVYADFKKEMLSDIASFKESIAKVSDEVLSIKESVSETSGEIISFKKEAFSSYEEVKKLISIQAEAREEALLSDEFISKRVEQFREFVDVFSSLEEKTITVNNADAQAIIEEMAKIVGKDIKEGVADSLQKNDVVRKFKSISGVSKKVEEQLDETIKGLKELLLHCQKGSEDIYTSEIILLKLMSVLRFLDRLSDKDRERIINSDFAVHEDVAKRIEAFLQGNSSSVIEKTTAKRQIPSVNQTFSKDKKIEEIETDIASINKRLNSIENTIEEKFNDILSALSRGQQFPREETQTQKRGSARADKKTKVSSSKKATVKNKKEDAEKTAKTIMDKMFPFDESIGSEG